MYIYDENGLPVTERKRRDELQYIRIYDDHELAQYSEACYVYCPENGILITCGCGYHWEAMQEHLADYIEANQWIKIKAGKTFMADDCTTLEDWQVASCEEFLMEDIILYSIDESIGRNPTENFLRGVNMGRLYSHKPTYTSITD